MKCSRINLCNRSNYDLRQTLDKKEISKPYYVTEEYHNYSFNFIRNKSFIHKSEPPIAVKNINFSEDFRSLNTGSSLEKWTKKRPRLKSGNAKEKTNELEYTEEYDISFDVSELLNEIKTKDNYEIDDDNCSMNNLEYEMHSDIEKLIMETEIESEKTQREKHEKRKKKKSLQKNKKCEDKEKKKVKSNLKKTIRFSFSKPPSPETEQVIRVDVTSTISMEDYENLESQRKWQNEIDCTKGHGKKINDDMKEAEENFQQIESLKLSKEDEDFIIRCRQLVISTKNRNRYKF